VPQSDLPSLARAQLRSVQSDARRFAGAATSPALQAHWADVAARAAAILDSDK
jgi:hypothetical protein